MTAFHLAPHVSLQYWRSVPRLVAVNRSAEADFAILAVEVSPPSVPNARLTTRFELPSQSEALDATVAAINAAYTLGHFDRQQRIAREVVPAHLLVNLDMIVPLPTIERGHDDRA